MLEDNNFQMVGVLSLLFTFFNGENLKITGMEKFSHRDFLLGFFSPNSHLINCQRNFPKKKLRGIYYPSNPEKADLLQRSFPVEFDQL